MSTLEELATAYQQSTTDMERERQANKISLFLYQNQHFAGMVRSMLFKKGKNLDRLDDALQESTILFVMKVLPVLRNPKAAWGALKGAIEIVGQRLGATFYDNERAIMMSLDATFGDDDGNTLENFLPSFTHSQDNRSTEEQIMDRISANKAKQFIHDAILESKMKGKNALSWLPKVYKSAKGAPLPVTRPVGKAVAEVGPKPPAKPKLDITPAYERLSRIRDITGMAIEPYAEALGIGLPRLRSYLNRKSQVHPEVLQSAEEWYAREGKAREARLKIIKSIPLPDLIDQWKKETGASSYAALAEIMGISVPTMARWRKPATKPMHDSHLLDADTKVSNYRKSHLKKTKPETVSGQERLSHIRNVTGMAIEPYAKALGIEAPRLRYYLKSRNIDIPSKTLLRAEEWYAIEGMARQARIEAIQHMPLPFLIEQWKKETHASSYTDLAKIMGISITTLARWRKQETKQIHNSHLLHASTRVYNYCKHQLEKDSEK